MNSTALAIRAENPDWTPSSVSGIGPSRSFYFLPAEVVRGAPADGFHRNEKPLLAKAYTMDGIRFNEFNGYYCANRYFRVRMYIYESRTHVIYIYSNSTSFSSSKPLLCLSLIGMGLDRATSNLASTTSPKRHAFTFLVLYGRIIAPRRRTRTAGLAASGSPTACCKL